MALSVVLQCPIERYK